MFTLLSYTYFGILHFALKVVYTFNVEREKYFFDEPRAKRAEIVGAKNFSPLHGGRRCVQTRYSANWYMKDALIFYSFTPEATPKSPLRIF